ncbi:MAG: DNA topoisomerase, partial [Candidatus Bathyarchaeota archaeon]
QNKKGEVSTVELRTVYQKPPVPFDVGELQREAYTIFGYNPRRTLAIAQRLYLDALISYPRTGSQKLPSVIDYRKILTFLKKHRGYKQLASRLLQNKVLKPRQGPKDDPAHPAIYPTGKVPKKQLSNDEGRIWDLIVHRFMAVFGEDAIKESTKISIEVNNHGFVIRGTRILEEGWLNYYKPYVRIKEQLLLPIKKGNKIWVHKGILDDKFTCPPSRFNPCSLLKKMEHLKIGTKATRANIIQTLYSRKYVKDKRIAVTELGFSVSMVLGKYAPLLCSIELTREIERSN